jgi:hypothetical protein
VEQSLPAGPRKRRLGQAKELPAVADNTLVEPNTDDAGAAAADAAAAAAAVVDAATAEAENIAAAAAAVDIGEECPVLEEDTASSPAVHMGSHVSSTAAAVEHIDAAHFPVHYAEQQRVGRSRHIAEADTGRVGLGRCSGAQQAWVDISVDTGSTDLMQRAAGQRVDLDIEGIALGKTVERELAAVARRPWSAFGHPRVSSWRSCAASTWRVNLGLTSLDQRPTTRRDKAVLIKYAKSNPSPDILSRTAPEAF